MMLVILLAVGIGLVQVLIWITLVAMQRSQKKQTSALAQAKQAGKERFEEVMAQETTKLGKHLAAQATAAEAHFEKALSEITSQQLQEFQAMLQSSQTKLAQAVTENEQALAKSRSAFQKEVTTDLQTTRAAKAAQIDDQIATIMVDYLAQVSGGLDFQQQKDTIFATLQANKEQLQKDIARGKV